MQKYDVHWADLEPPPAQGDGRLDVYLASDVAELEQQLAFANDAAAKGEAARLAAAGMQERITELEIERDQWKDTLRQARLEWAMVCSCRCQACDDIYETLIRLSP